jgi:hypothetical protein
MHLSQKWGRSRYVALLVVFALHGVLLTVIFILPRTRLLSSSATAPIELLILPPQNTPKPPLPPAASSRDRKEIPASTPPSSTAITIIPHADAGNARASVDWEREAQNVAAAIANGGSPKKERPSETNSPFAPSPPHHVGEQFAAADGRWILYVSDRCYQVSSAIGTVTNASHNGMGLQTYCTRPSNTPRGDLFNQLPAYKMYHPEN